MMIRWFGSMSTLLAAGALMVVMAACGPPFEEGQVVDTWFTEGWYSESCMSNYITVPDGSGGFMQVYAGQTCRDVWNRGFWSIEVVGVDDDGEQSRHTAKVYLPRESPPAEEGDRFSLVEMRVVNPR